MRLQFTGSEFVVACSYAERELPKKAGFRWHPNKQRWYTPSHAVAARLRDYADETAKTEISRVLLSFSPWTEPLSHPKSLKLYDFQKTAIEYGLSRNRAYLALDPGLGKTICAAVMAETLKKPCLYICPPFLVANTLKEFERWAPSLLPRVVPDSRLHQPKTLDSINAFVTANPDALLFIDEAHRFKNEDSRRGMHLYTFILKKFERAYFLSGTPMPNRPMELFAILSNAAPEVIDYMGKFEYGRKYCGGHRNDFGWDFSGASNLKDLASRVKKHFMIRMKKEDVLKELPPKTEELMVIGESLPPTTAKMDKELLEVYSPEDLMHGIIEAKKEGETLHLATYRRELGNAKVKPALEFLQGVLEDTDESILVFTIHKEVVRKLSEGLKRYHPYVITGETPMRLRDEYVRGFQNQKERRLFIGNILACGTGFTLTKATRVVFVEFSWTPAENDQASDRAHRIGQKGNVYVQYLVYQNSIDRAVIETIFRKRKVINYV